MNSQARQSNRLRLWSTRRTTNKENSEKEEMSFKPFEQTISALKEIPEINSPMKKMEFINQIFNTIMVSEIE